MKFALPRSASPARRLRNVIASALVVTIVAAGCDADVFSDKSSARTVLPEGQTVIVEGSDAVTLALRTSQALFQSAPAVVLVGEENPEAFTAATQKAIELGVPVLVTPEPTPGGTADVLAADGPSADLRAEISRLGVGRVVTSGSGAVGWASAAALGDSIKYYTVEGGGPSDVHPGDALSELLVLVANNSFSAAATATAEAAGAKVITLPTADPRATHESIEAIAGAPSLDHVLALGTDFGPADKLQTRLAVAKTGVELPGGGQLVFPYRRMVALYGHPAPNRDPVLGILGEAGETTCAGQDLTFSGSEMDQSIARAKAVAASYENYLSEPVVPTFEIITTTASSSAGADGDWSNEPEPDAFIPWIEAAQANGIYVMLDLQPWGQDFLSQAQQYEVLLRYPNVGLAIDPEWRAWGGNTLADPDHVIGRVKADEVNATAEWLDQLAAENNLPEKLFIIHWFKAYSLDDPAKGYYLDQIHTDYENLAVMIHVDGFGTQPAKMDTWNYLRGLARDAGLDVYWAWKNFCDEDDPMLNPQQTVAVSNDIYFISYQ